MLIYLIRHAQTHANAGGIEQTITKEGLKQIKCLAKAVSPVELSYSSDQHRATITAQGISKALKSSIVINPDLAEIYACIVGGDTKDPDAKRIISDPKRADKAFEFIKNIDAKTVAIICHGNIIRYFIAKAANLPFKNMWRFDIKNCSITTLKVEKEKNIVNILSVNNISHLKTLIK